jgi:predicted glycosyltransferase
MIMRFKDLNSVYVKETQNVTKPPENLQEFKKRCKNLIESAMGSYIEIEEDKNRLSKIQPKQIKIDLKV